ncbi:MAG: methyltransferase domain-containing protein [Candidatus Dormibacteria bacterium]
MPSHHRSRPYHWTPQEWSRQYFDTYGEQEWDRLANSAAGRTSFRQHAKLIHEFLSPGWHALEAGAGPGRFTAVLLDHGVDVTVTDISQQQLKLNEEHVPQGSHGPGAIKGRYQMDICDLRTFADGTFDASLALGGPLSYVFDAAPTALQELIRVTKRGGILIVSVMSLYGALRVYLPNVLTQLRTPEFRDRFRNILTTGDIPIVDATHHSCRMYTSERLTNLITSQGCSLLHMQASNMLTASEELATHDPSTYHRHGPRTSIDDLLTPGTSQILNEYEDAACRSAGNADSGTHIIAVCTTPT